MKPEEGSQTAKFAAANRALESEKPAERRVGYDPLARKFIGPAAYWRFRISRFLRQPRGSTLQGFVVYRGRYFDEFLRTRIAAGAEQVVNLGAGWDTHAYRGEILERGIRTFEVDHPATQAEKIRAAKRIFRMLPPHVVYVPMDFLAESLDKLSAYGFDPTIRTAFFCEGVSYYLTEAAIDSLLGWIRSRAAEGSAVALDYKYPRHAARAPRRAGRRGGGFTPARTGESIQFTIGRTEAEEKFARFGFVRIQNVAVEELPGKFGPGWNLSRWGLDRFGLISGEVGRQ